MEKLKKILKIAGITVGALFGLAVVVFGYQYYRIKTGDIVQYNGKWMTRAQYDFVVKTLGDQYVETPAKNTPEEVYAKFREAVLKDDFTEALEQISPSRREGWKKVFENVTKKEELEKWKKSLPEKLKLEKIEGNYAQFEIDYGTQQYNGVTFSKDISGYWHIDSL